ncbi:MAG: hypothetical protein AMXMBFR84_01680 [Candidatus Hydrogenedentota bacterium]
MPERDVQPTYRTGYLAALAAVIAGAFVLRFWGVGELSLSYDEVFELVRVEHFWAYLTTGELRSGHPPLLGALIYFWRAIGLVTSEAAIHLLPVLLGTGAVFTAWLAAHAWGGPRVALVTAILVAISPFHIYHSRELKDSVLLSTLVPLLIFCLILAARNNRPRDWSAYALCAAACCYAGYFAAPILVAINLWFPLFHWRDRSRLTWWIGANAVGAALFLPWLRVMLIDANVLFVQAEAWWVPKPDAVNIALYFKTIAFGYSDAKPLYPIALGVLILLVSLGLYRAWQDNRKYGTLLVLWILVPVLLVIAISMASTSIFLYRSMLGFAFPLYIAQAIALAALPNRIARAGATGLVCALAIVPLHAMYTLRYPLHEFPHRPGVRAALPFEAAADYVSLGWKDGDIVVHATRSTALPFYWYGFRERPQASVAVDQNHIDALMKGDPVVTKLEQFVRLFKNEHVQSVVEGHRRVWYVFSDWEREFYGGNCMAVWRWLDAHYTETDHVVLRDIEIFCYETADENAVAVRDNDNGVQAEITFEGGATYTQSLPDAGLIPVPLERRRGDLVLRFDKTGGPADGNRQKIAFVLENRSERDVPVTVYALASDYLIEAAALYEHDATSNVWRVNPHFNPSPPPTEYELTTAAAVTGEGESADLQGGLSIVPGDYTAWLYLIPSTDNPRESRSRLRVFANDTVLFPGIGLVNSGEWQWIEGNLTTITDSASTVIRIEAESPSASNPCYADIGYVALARRRQAAAGENPSWPGDLVIERGETRSWSKEIPADIQRVDVWVFERQEGGKAYRISELYNNR